ncbi:MAG: (2Fe-2S)-binding protein [Gammaproteobacteria bacterium]|nr:(2Fe-2S)-binding protein [Gammaproteobacteria bacterium]
MKFKLMVNEQVRPIDADEATPLLWVIRETLGLTGTKFGCGIGACGACTVHVNGRPMRSCVVPVRAVASAAVTTIEGLGASSMHPVQQAWIDAQVPQCGYCQTGVIMTVAALLEENPEPSEDDLARQLSNLCRCGTYTRMRKAIRILRRS